MKNVTSPSGDGLVYFHTLTVVSNVYMKMGYTYDCS